MYVYGFINHSKREREKRRAVGKVADDDPPRV